MNENGARTASPPVQASCLRSIYRGEENEQLCEVLNIQEIEGQLLVTLKHKPGFSVWNKAFLSRKQKLKWRTASVGLVEIGHEVRDTSICVLEPINHQYRLQEGMILVDDETTNK